MKVYEHSKKNHKIEEPLNITVQGDCIHNLSVVLPFLSDLSSSVFCALARAKSTFPARGRQEMKLAFPIGVGSPDETGEMSAAG